MKSFLQDKLNYHYNCNAQIIRSLLSAPQAVTVNMIKLISHTLHAQGIWNNRILDLPYEGGVWQEIELDQLTELNRRLYRQSLEILEGVDLNREVKYKNSKRQEFRNSVSEILYHIVNHGTYHRGQMMMMMSSAGMKTYGTDYILYKRER